MADEVEKTEDPTSAALKTDTRVGQGLDMAKHELSFTKISEPQSPSKPEVTFAESPEINAKREDRAVLFETTNVGDESTVKKPVTPNPPRQPRSACRARSRDTRQCQKHFQEMIGKHETRNDELEQREVDLRQRLNMLECSMPAVMSWNMWRMTQNAPVSNVRRLLQKQFQDQDAARTGVPTTPSKHYDCRVREIEAERKEALRRAEEARVLLAEKEAAVQERRKLLEDAKRCNQERREKMEKLNREAEELRSALKNARGDDNSCETGECDEIRCREKWLDSVGSVSSIGSTDLECFAKLQELAEAEICMKRQITELERREEAYMRTLQQADELWSKMEGDSADRVSDLQDQLGSKTAANQQLADRVCSLEDELEKSRLKLIGCKDALLRFTDRKFSDIETGFANGEATVKDRGIVAAVRTATASAVAIPTTADQETLALPEGVDEESSFVPELVDAASTASVKMLDKDTEAIVDLVDRGVDRPSGLGIDVGVGDEEALVESPEGFGPNTGALRRVERRGSESADVEDNEVTPKDSDGWDWDEGCPPGAVCDDLIESSTGTGDVQEPKDVTTAKSKVLAALEVVDQPVSGRRAEHPAEIEPEVLFRFTDATQQAIRLPEVSEAAEVKKGTHETVPETDQIVLSREELRNWYNIVDSVHHVIAKCVNCSSKIEDTVQLAEKMKLYLKIKGLSGVKGPTGLEQSAKPVAAADSPELVDATDSSILGEVRHLSQVERTDDIEPVADHRKAYPGPESTQPAAAEIPGEIEAEKEIDAHSDILVDETSSDPTKLSDDFAGVLHAPKDVAEPDVRDRKPLEPESTEPETEEIPKEIEARKEIDAHSDILVDETSSDPTKLSDDFAGVLHAPKDVAEPDVRDRKPLEPESTEPETEEIPKEIEARKEIEADPTDSLVDETLTDSTELSHELVEGSKEQELVEGSKEQELVEGSKEQELESGHSEEPSAQPLQVSADQAETKQPVTSEITSGVEASKSEVESKEETRLEETAISFVTPRTPPPSRMDVQFSERAEDSPDVIEQTSDYLDEALIRSEQLEIAEDSSQQETPTQPTIDAEGTPQSDIERETPETPSPPVEARLELLADKVPDKISVEGLIAEVAEPSVIAKPRSSISKVKSVEKVKSPKSLDRCICKPRTCPLIQLKLDRTAGRESKPKAPKLFTEGTQTSSQMPRSLPERLDKLKLSTITESTWPSPELGIWRRPMFWPRRPRDKSTLTTACVDIQTDSGLVRGRTPLEGIDRKDRTTITGVCPRYTEHGGCPERISSQPRGPVGLAVAELFGGPVRFPTGMASSIEKEAAAVKCDGGSLAAQESEFHCVECGRPITPDGTPLAGKPGLSISSISRKPIMTSMKGVRSSTTTVTGAKEECTCCDCRTSDDRNVKENDDLRNRGNAEKRSENTDAEKSSEKGNAEISTEKGNAEKGSEKGNAEKSFEDIVPDNNICCPCPAEITKIMSAKSPKSNRKKKRKPETKDQSVMAYIPKLKPLSKKPRNGDTALTANNTGDSTISSSRMVSSSSPIEASSTTNEVSQCRCDEDSIDDASFAKDSSIFKEKIAKRESRNGANDKSSMDEKMSRNYSSIDSVSTEENSCNCEPLAR